MRRAGPALALCGAVVAADQATKALVRSLVAPGETVHLTLGTQIVDVHNRGAAFGLFAGGHAPMVAISVVALALLALYVVRHAATPGAWAAAALVAGGALGNLADRARVGSVTDFLDPPLWPAFNLADVAIVAGVALIVLRIAREAA